MADATQVMMALARLSHGIAEKVDSRPTGVAPGYHAALGGTVLPNGRLRYASAQGVLGALLAFYTRGASSQSVTVGSEVRLNWATQVYDPDSLITTGASWRFTAPATAVYGLQAYASIASFASGAIIAGEFIDLLVRDHADDSYINTIDYRDVTARASGSSSRYVYLHGTMPFSLTAGQAIYITAENQTSVDAVALSTDDNLFAVYRLT